MLVDWDIKFEVLWLMLLEFCRLFFWVVFVIILEFGVIVLSFEFKLIDGFGGGIFLLELLFFVLVFLVIFCLFFEVFFVGWWFVGWFFWVSDVFELFLSSFDFLFLFKLINLFFDCLVRFWSFCFKCSFFFLNDFLLNDILVFYCWCGCGC